MTATQAPPADAPERPRARDRIFDVAKDLFYRRGIRAVGVETIVEAAGATKMSLYRSFSSKDDLVAAYLRERDSRYWHWWDKIVEQHADSPRSQLRALLKSIAERTLTPNYRGCPFTNAAVEFPEPDHPSRAIAAANKEELRRRLTELSEQLGARNPPELADQLLLLIEGAYSASQTLGTTGPSRALVAAAETLIDAQIAR